MLHLGYAYKKFLQTIFVDDAEDLDFVLPIYNLLEYSENYSMISRCLWNYLSMKQNEVENEVGNRENRDGVENVNDNVSDGKLFKV